MKTAAIVLAAGAGTRMKSDKPKVAHEVLGKPLVNWVLDAAEEAGIERLVTVVGHKREQVIPLVEDRAEIVVQEEQRGTAHAVLSCSDALADFEGSLLVLSGDCPLITSETMKALIDMRESNDAAVVVLTMEMADPTGYGRIIREAPDHLAAGGLQQGAEARVAGHVRAAVLDGDGDFLADLGKRLGHVAPTFEFSLLAEFKGSSHGSCYFWFSIREMYFWMS